MLSTYVRVTNLLTRLRSDERGVTAVEYGILAAAIAAVIVGAVVSLGSTLNGVFSGINTTVTAIPG